MFSCAQHTQHVAVGATGCERPEAVRKTNHFRHSLENGLLNNGSDGRKFVRVHRIVRHGGDDLTGEGGEREASPQRVHEFRPVGFHAVGDERVEVVQHRIKTVPFKRQMNVQRFSHS